MVRRLAQHSNLPTFPANVPRPFADVSAQGLQVKHDMEAKKTSQAQQ